MRRSVATSSGRSSTGMAQFYHRAGIDQHRQTP